MDFKEQIKQLSEHVGKNKDACATEEATKTSLILPFIEVLGFDYRNPYEVIPEYICDKRINRSEKIDYAIMKEGKLVILIECKKCKEDLTPADVGHLRKYYQMASSKFGVLTNGANYKFFTDLDKTNKMDEEPFLDINMLDLQDNQIEMLNKFQKSNFKVDSILKSAEDTKKINILRKKIFDEFTEPSKEFVKFFTRKIYSGQFNETVCEIYTELMKKSLKNFFTEKEMIEKVIKMLEKDGRSKPSTTLPPSGNISVTFRDGEIINRKNVTDTFVECIEKIGFEKIMDLKIISSGIPLISKIKEERPQRQIGEFWISTNSSTNSKASILNKINRELDLKLKIEIYSQQP